MRHLAHRSRRRVKRCDRHPFAHYLLELGCVICAADNESIKRGYKPWTPTNDRFGYEIGKLNAEASLGH